MQLVLEPEKPLCTGKLPLKRKITFRLRMLILFFVSNSDEQMLFKKKNSSEKYLLAFPKKYFFWTCINSIIANKKMLKCSKMLPNID